MDNDATVTDTVADVKATATAPEQTADEPKKTEPEQKKVDADEIVKKLQKRIGAEQSKKNSYKQQLEEALDKIKQLEANQSRNCPTRIKLKRIQTRRTSESRNSKHRLRTAKRLTRQIRFSAIPVCRSRLTFSASLFQTTLIRHTRMSRLLSTTRNRSRILCVRNSARATHRVCPAKRSEK